MSGMARGPAQRGAHGNRIARAGGTWRLRLRAQDVQRCRPDPPDPAGQARQDRRALLPARRLSGARRRRECDQRAGPGRDHRRGRLPHLGADAPALERAGARTARRGRRDGGRGRDLVPQPSLLHRGDDGLRQARRSRALPQHRLRGTAAGRRSRAGEARCADLRPGVHRSALRRRRLGTPLRRLGGEGGDRRNHARAVDLEVSRRGPRASLRAWPLHHPHLRHDGHTQGRPAQRAGGPRLPGGAVLEDPAPLRRDGDDRRAPVPLLGVPALHAEPADRGDDGLDDRSSTRRTRCGPQPSTGQGSSRWSR